MNVALLVAQTLIVVWPSYVANATPVLSRRIFKKPHYVDFGKYLWDGRRILGDGKTFEGLLVGFTAGTLVGYFIVFMVKLMVGSLFKYPSLMDSAVLSISALAGDMVGAFIKRRIGLKRGDPAPLLDQLDFLVTSILVLRAIDPSLVTLSILITAIVITPPIHLATNAIAYVLGLKGEPW